MTREQLAHLLRSASQIAGDPDVLVLGSQAILGSYSEAELPEEAWLSIEADVSFLDDPDGIKALTVDAAIGELSEFHQMYSYYSQGVDVAVAILPAGWRNRLIPFRPRSSEPAQAWCLEAHDLVVAKLAAARQKDLVFASALLEANLVAVDLLRSRASGLSDDFAIQRRWVIDWLDRYSSTH